MSGKRRISTVGPKWEVNYLYSGQLSTSLCIKTVIIFQKHFVHNIEINGSDQNFQKFGNIIRSSADSKWQSCMRETDADRSWQAGPGEPANEMNKEDPTQGIPVWLQAFTVNAEDLEAHVLAHSSERVISDSEGEASKVETQKRNHSVHAYFRKNQKRSILRTEKYGDLTTAEHKVLNEGRESRKNHRHAVVVHVLATQWNPCQTKTSQETEKNLRTFLQPSQKPKVIHMCNSLEFGKYCEASSWNHPTTTLHRSEISGIAERAARRIKEGTSAVFLQSGSDDKQWLDSV